LRAAIALVAAALLAACDTSARVDNMTAAPLPPTPSSSPSPVTAASPAFEAIAVGSITGGSEATKLWVSNVSNENFRTALQQSLQREAMAAANGMANSAGRYRLNAELIELDQPLAGFNFTVTARVHYRLVPVDDPQTPRFDQVVETPYTTKFGENVLSAERLRIATEGAVRENIGVVVHQLIETLQQPVEPGSGSAG
jgi:hypothetical protein